MAEQRYYKSKGDRLKTVLISSIMMVLGGGLIYYNVRFVDPPNSWINLAGLALVGIGVFQLGRMFQNQAIVVANASGLKARSLGNAVVAWSYIQRFEVVTVEGEQVLLAKARNQQKMLKDFNHAVRAVMKANIKDYGAAIALPQGMLNAPVQQIAEELEVIRKAKK